MSDYTPTAEEVEHAYLDWRDFQAQITHIERPADDEIRADFRRWLAAHDRQVLLNAADKAFKDKSIQGLARATIGNWLRMQAN